MHYMPSVYCFQYFCPLVVEFDLVSAELVGGMESIIVIKGEESTQKESQMRFISLSLS